MLMAKPLLKTNQSIRCFELIQAQYSETPAYSILLLVYGKLVIKTIEAERKKRRTVKLQGEGRKTLGTPKVDSGYLGSGIGALEECTRLCLAERQPLINFLIGRAYKILKMPLKTYEYWRTASIQNEQKNQLSP